MNLGLIIHSLPLWLRLMRIALLSILLLLYTVTIFSLQKAKLFKATGSLISRNLSLKAKEMADLDLNASSTVLVVAAAQWQKPSMKMLQDITTNFASSEEVKVFPIMVDDDEEMEKAMEMNMMDIPCVHIYKDGQLTTALTKAFTVADVKNAIDKANSPSSSSCCAPAIADGDVHSFVASSYAATVKGAASCCVSVDSTLNGYSVDDLITAASANLGLGCGNPLSFANLQLGETVVDLGSGAGIDCFIASTRVGPTGAILSLIPLLSHTIPYVSYLIPHTLYLILTGTSMYHVSCVYTFRSIHRKVYLK